MKKYLVIKEIPIDYECGHEIYEFDDEESAEKQYREFVKDISTTSICDGDLRSVWMCQILKRSIVEKYKVAGL